MMGSRGDGGITAAGLAHALRYGNKTLQSNGAYRYESKHATAVLNSAGKLITSWAKSKKFRRS
jgi:hypothetical protein